MAESGARRSDDQADQRGDWKPRPDPTELTTEALNREVKRLDGDLDSEVKRLEELLGLRITHVKDGLAKELRRIDEKFDLVERQRIEQKADTQRAVDAALSAQKEAVREQTIASEKAIDKSEKATSKQLEDLRKEMSTAHDGLRREIGDTKDRTTALETRKVAVSEVRADTRAGYGLYVAAASVVITVVLGALGLIVAFAPH